MSYPVRRCLAFDFGLKHIGVAVGECRGRTAQALNVVPAKQGVPCWRTLDRCVAEWAPDVLVVGLPLQADGRAQPITGHAQTFADRLASRYALPVAWQDERYTTVSARENLFSQKGRRGLRKDAIDLEAARLICEAWLFQQPKGR